jgi:hypothetical protein
MVMGIVKATRRYEKWIGERVDLDREDLRLKHQLMSEGLFPFFRATFYRWMQLWPNVCPKLNNAPRILAVGDLHVENFGTWRDSEGRLVWGVNDFDEAAVLPYTLDLVRLAASSIAASKEGQLSLKLGEACEIMLFQYREAMQSGGRPFVLAEQNKWLRDIATSELRDPEHFWEKMDGLKKIKGTIPAGAKKALRTLLPEHDFEWHVVKRVAGAGSRGHPRYVAVAYWRGGQIAREAKALGPSAVYWAEGKSGPKRLSYESVMDHAVRCPDPFVRIHKRWLVRRLAPYCSRIELAVLPKERDELKLLSAMAYETANIHLGTRGARNQILRHLKRVKAGWLLAGAEAMIKAITQDWKEWRKAF